MPHRRAIAVDEEVRLAAVLTVLIGWPVFSRHRCDGDHRGVPMFMSGEGKARARILRKDVF